MKEKQIETMFADISDTLHKHIDLEPYRYTSVEYAKKYNNMRVCIDIPSIINELYDMGYRKQIEGAWKLNSDGSGTCNQCGITQKNVWDYDNWQNFCGHCGAKMIKGE